MSWAGNVKLINLRAGVCDVLVMKRKRKMLPGRSSCKWVFNIKTEIMDVCWRAWSALKWMCDYALCEIQLTCIRIVLSDL